MRRLVLALALLALVTIGTAGALEVRTVHTGTAVWDGSRAAGSGIWIQTGLFTSALDLPRGIILWTGDGSDYWMQYVTEEGGTLESSNPQRIPSYLLVPLPVGYDSTSSGVIVGWKKGVYVSSPTDSIFYRWTW